MHSVIIFVVCLIFMFVVFVPSNLLGGIDDVSRSLPAHLPSRMPPNQ
jgi:hypothetical protein